MTEARIRDIEARLSTAEIIDPRKLGTPTRVVFGSSVRIEDMDTGEQKVISIYGNEESDIEKGWISYEAPLGKFLIGKEAGDVARIVLPTGAKEYEVLEIFIQYEDDAETETAAAE
jgi:transcription elongation factor GreA